MLIYCKINEPEENIFKSYGFFKIIYQSIFVDLTPLVLLQKLTITTNKWKKKTWLLYLNYGNHQSIMVCHISLLMVFVVKRLNQW